MAGILFFKGLLLVCFFAVSGSVMPGVYVSPDGKPTNKGTIESPLDLQTALDQPRTVTDARVIYMRSGTYRGVFVSRLQGERDRPITLRSAPGEWAVIDGNYRLTLDRAIGTGYDTAVYFKENTNLPDVFNLLIDRESIQFAGRQNGGYRMNDRGRDGTRIASHEAGAVCVVSMAAFDAIAPRSSWAIYRDFEITNSLPTRTIATSGSNAADPDYRQASIIFAAPNSKLINLVIHDGGDVGFWANAANSEIYGCIIYNSGHDAPTGPHGVGIYTQNSDGVKKIGDNIIFGTYGGTVMQLYGSSASTLRGYELDGNIALRKRWLMGGNAPADDITVTNNFLYEMGMEFGYGNPFNQSAVIENNYLSGGTLDIKYWQQITSRGNHLYSKWPISGAPMVIRFRDDDSALANYSFSNNDYIYGRQTISDPPFIVNIDGRDGRQYTLAQWRAKGFDLDSTLKWEYFRDPKMFSRPHGQDVFYRPNKYETGRGNVIVFSYDGAAAVRIDPSKVGLREGKRFEIRNGLNYKAGVLYSGTYTGKPVDIKFSDLKIAQPFGNTTRANPEASPQFAVLVIVPSHP